MIYHFNILQLFANVDPRLFKHIYRCVQLGYPHPTSINNCTSCYTDIGTLLERARATVPKARTDSRFKPEELEELALAYLTNDIVIARPPGLQVRRARRSIPLWLRR